MVQNSSQSKIQNWSSGNLILQQIPPMVKSWLDRKPNLQHIDEKNMKNASILTVVNPSCNTNVGVDAILKKHVSATANPSKSYRIEPKLQHPSRSQEKPAQHAV